MNVLLVYPEFDSFWGWKGLRKFVGKKSAFPPLGLLTVAAMLPAFWVKKLVDMNVKRLKDKDIKRADYVFISARSDQEESAKMVIKRCNQLGIPAVLGGTILQTEEWCDKFFGVSHFFLGKANDTIPEFIGGLETGRLKKIFKPESFPDIKKTPIPLWELVDPRNYTSGIVEYSMGCPFHCKFCNSNTVSGPWQAKPPEQFEAELEALFNAGFRGSVLLADENVVGKTREAKKALQIIAEWQQKKGYPFKFTGQVPVTIAGDEKLLAMKAKAGFVRVFLGIETFNQAALRECKKVQNLGRDLVACVHKILSHGIDVASGFIVGFDSDPPDTFVNDMICGIQKTGIGIAMVDTLQAQPGTELFEELNCQKRILSDATDNTRECTNFRPAMPMKALKEGYKKIVRTIYDPKKCYERTCIFLKKYNPSKRVNKELTWSDIRVLLKSVFWIGIPFKGFRVSYYYWKTFLVAFFKHRQAFSAVMARQIQAVHFREFFAKALF